MNTGVPVGPLVPRKRRSLLRREDDNCVVRPAALAERVQQLAHFPVPRDDLSEVGRELLPRPRGVGEILRKDELVNVDSFGVANRPKGVRLVESSDEEERLVRVAAHEFCYRARVELWIGSHLARVRHARDVLETK